MNSLPAKVRIVEVGPRDGLQNESRPVSLEQKLALIERLIDAGLTTIEAGSFVNPARVPQMADSDQLLRALVNRPGTDSITFTALTPNVKGLERALEAGVKEVAVFAAASDTFSHKNINCSMADSLQRFEPLARQARDNGVTLRGYISCAFGCPYEGTVDARQVLSLSKALLDMGCYEVSLGDTIGVATANRITELLQHMTPTLPVDKLALHLHDTYGQAIANTLAGLEAGVSVFDASVAGLGGCPFAPGASGNVATEDLVYLLNGLGIEHTIDLDKLVQTGHWISTVLERPYGSRAGSALTAKD